MPEVTFVFVGEGPDRVMLEEKQLFTVLSNDDLEQISGGFNPVKYGKYVINEFVKGFRQAW